MQELISESYAPPEAWLLLGRSFHALGDYSRALAAFNDYLRQNSRSSQGYLFMGRTYITVGMPQRAIPYLKKAHELHPQNIQITALLAMAYLKSRRSQLALETFQAAVEGAAKAGIGKKESKRLYRAYLNSLMVRGVRLCRAGEYELGAQMLRFVLENGDEDRVDGPYIRLELGRASRETGKLDEALEHYTRALEFAPHDRRIRWSRVSILMALGKNTEALEDISRIRSQEPGVPELPWNSRLVDIFMIRSFMESGDWRQSAELCRNHLRYEDSEFPQGKGMIHALYAESLRNLRDFKSAHNHLLRAIEENPDDLELWYADIMVSWEARDWKALKKALRIAKNLGGEADLIRRFTVLYQARTSEDSQGTLKLLQNAVRTLGPEPELMYSLGETYLKLGFPEQAVSWFKKIIQIKENHEEAWLGEIAALEALVQEGMASEKLAELYNAYLERWPDNYTIRRERALFLIKILEYAEAAAELEKLLLLEPSNPSLRRVLAYAYRKTGRYREAAVFLKSLLREKPENLELLLEYSGCLERAGGVRYAVMVLEKAQEIFTNSPDLSMALGILSFRQKKVENAFDYLREAANLNKKDPRPYEWMAVIAQKNGDADRGRYYEKEALKRKKGAIKT